MKRPKYLVKPTVQKPKDSSFTLINVKEMQWIPILKKPEPADVWHICLKMAKTINWLSESAVD